MHANCVYVHVCVCERESVSVSVSSIIHFCLPAYMYIFDELLSTLILCQQNLLFAAIVIMRHVCIIIDEYVMDADVMVCLTRFTGRN